MNQHASINRIYRLIWSEVRSAWVPVAETTRGRGKSGRAPSIASRNLVAAAISLALAPLAHAAAPPAHATPPCAAPVCGPTALSATNHPLGGKVVSGSARISQVGNTTDIRQSSTDVAIDWLNFSIGPQATVDFLQPSASAVAVNRISSTNGSEILGHLDANGQVYLINPNGIIFGKGSQVNVGGLVASTLDVSESSLSGSTRSFSGEGTNSIVNEGTISAANGGYVALVGNRVSNEGVISAQLGTVALGSGSAVTLDFSGNRLVHVQVDRGTLDNLAENKQLIEAGGGLVIMTAGAKDALLASVVNNTGVIEARTVENHAGTIELLGGMSAGTVKVGGTLDASAPQGGNGGSIETDGAHVEVANDAKVTTAALKGLTGSWLIDPQDFTVAASGGDITGATLSKDLTTTSVTLESSQGSKAGSGNVNVDDTVSWYANTKLTLTASNDVNVNENITATGSTAALAINPNTANGPETASGTGTFNLRAGASITLSGADESLSIAKPSYTLGAGAGIYLANVSPTSTTALTIGGAAYTVINSLGAAGSTTGTDLQGIEGKLAGHYALGSNIDASATATWNSNRAATPVYAGFTPIGTATTPFTGTFEGLGHTISDLTIDRPTTSDVGLIGKSGKAAVIRDVGSIGGSVSGSSYVGALVGQSGGAVSNSYATGSVAGTSSVVGGLVGQTSGTVSDSYATGSVAGTGNGVGGLVGQNNGTVSDSYATANTVGSSLEVGGLVGQNYAGTVSDSYATGNVKGVGDVGGLVGYNVGSHSTIGTSYAKGAVSGSGSTVGGLAGNSTGSITGSFWDVTTSGQSTSAGGAMGLTTAQMQTAADLTGFTFTSTPDAAGNNWVLIDLNGTLNNAFGAAGATFPMLASEYTTRIENAHQLQLMEMNTGATYAVGQNIDASTTGTGTDVWGSSGFIPIGNSSVAFTGTFDGLLHSLSKLTINLPSNSNVGLFGVAGPGSVIEEVGLAGGSINGSSYVGGLVGKSQGVINEAYATDDVSGASSVVGGLVGQTSGTVSDSYATGSVAGTGNGVGGLVGQNNGTVSDSYATGSATGSNLEVGGLVGQNQGSVTDSYALGNVSGANDVGGLVGYNVGAHAAIRITYAKGEVSGSGSYVGGLAGNSTDGIANSFWDVMTSGQSKSAGGAVGLTTSQMQTAANFEGFNFTSTPGAPGNNWILVDINGSFNNASGAQGATLPMLASEYSTTIDNAHQLQLMAMNLAGAYTMGQNIDASATGTGADVWGSSGFLSIGSTSAFTGTLDGLMHTVTGLTINPQLYATTGLFGIAGKGAVIEEVGLVGGSISGYSNVGALVGDNTYGKINQSYSTANVKAYQEIAGGLIGYNYANATVSNSYATGQVTSNGGYVGGLVGENQGTVSNSHATGQSIFGGGYVGGLVGMNRGSISGSYATEPVSSNHGYVGGLVGENRGNVSSSHATGPVADTGTVDYVGGLVGLNEGPISNSYASGEVTGSAGYIGGLVGENLGVSISSSYATGNVSGSGTYGVTGNLVSGAYVGGLVGYNSGPINDSHATGSVSAGASNYVGGIAGYNSGAVNDSYATGGVSGAGIVAGLAGYSSAAITNSYATGNVSGTAVDVGGLVGDNVDSIVNTYATGSVSGSSNVGGLVGINTGTVTTSYSTGSVTGSTNVGGLVGDSPGIVSASFWNVTTSGLTASSGGTGLTTAQMEIETTFTSAGWNFTSIWYLPTGKFPMLQGLESTQ